MKRNRKKILVTVSLVLAFIFTCSSLTFFAADNNIPIEKNIEMGAIAVPASKALSVDCTGRSLAETISTRSVSSQTTYSWTYQTGEYLSKTRHSQCANCHTTKGGYIKCDTTGVNCNCKAVNRSIQCFAYAQQAFFDITGYFPMFVEEADQNTYTIADTGVISSVSTLKNTLKNYDCPIFLRVTGTNIASHYICIIELSDTGILYCDGNGTNERCYIQNEVFLTYTEFLQRYYRIIEGKAPFDCENHSFTQLSRSSNYHWYSCYTCGDGSDTLLTHNMFNGHCTVCGQLNTHTSLEWRRDITHHWKVCTDCNDLQITNKETHDFGAANLICECGARNVSINSQQPPASIE